MEVQAAFDNHVRSKLESSFGKAVAMLILATASNTANTHTMSLDRDQYMRLCEAITRDQRVQDMWGVSGAADTLNQWKQLAS